MLLPVKRRLVAAEYLLKRVKLRQRLVLFDELPENIPHIGEFELFVAVQTEKLRSMALAVGVARKLVAALSAVRARNISLIVVEDVLDKTGIRRGI